jgi:SAM-dependent methyltransferase
MLRGVVDFEWQTLNAAMARVAPMAGGRLLDVGCGDKPWEQVLAPYVTEHVGVEFAETFAPSMNAAQSRADVLYSGDRLPFDDATFDTVLSNQVLEHVPDPHAHFTDLVRVLRPGGRLLLTVPFSFRLHSEPYDFWRFTRHGLAELSRRNAMDVEVLEERGGLWRVVGQKIATFLAFRLGRFEQQLQEAGGNTYQPRAARGPRWWAVPVVVPMIVVVTLIARFLDDVARDPADTLGYVLVARKAPVT